MSRLWRWLKRLIVVVLVLILILVLAIGGLFTWLVVRGFPQREGTVQLPSIWFLVGLHCQPVGPDCPYEVAGAGFPGVPGSSPWPTAPPQ